MKTFIKITYIFSLIAITAVGVVFGSTEKAVAQTCTSDSTPGNLYGYITASNIPTEIYLSKESWNDLSGGTPTTEDFYVTYDRFTELWSGRGWSETVGWVEFNTGSLDKKAYVEDAVANPSNWGYWDGALELYEVTSLIPFETIQVVYSTNAGGFTGFGYSSDYTGNDPDGDVYVGLGELGFSNISFIPDNPCNENVDLFLNDTRTLDRDTCPISAPTIKWTSENVDNCVTDEGFWTGGSGVSKSLENMTGETASSGLSSEGSQRFRLKCVGNTTGTDVYGTATMRCGPSGPGGDPEDSKIIPIIIEA